MKKLIINGYVYELDHMIQYSRDVTKSFDGKPMEWVHNITLSFDENKNLGVTNLQNVLIISIYPDAKYGIDGIVTSAKDGEIRLMAFGNVLKDGLTITSK